MDATENNSGMSYNNSQRCGHMETAAIVNIGCCKVQEHAWEGGKKGGTEGGGNMLESKRWWHLTLECKGDVSCVVFLQVGVRGKDVSLNSYS